MRAREELYAALMSGGPHSPDRSEQASARIDAYRDTVLNGTEVNPSPLVMDAKAYRWLAAEIGKTMADPNRWDGDESEQEILARYVRWLTAERDQVRAEVLIEAADKADEISYAMRDGGDDWSSRAGWAVAVAAVQLRRMATAGKASPAGPTATQPAADACARCGRPFDPRDLSFDGHARQGSTPFCRRCVDRCHESEDAGHACPVCRQGGEAR
jgi:hypothetical protein